MQRTNTKKLIEASLMIALATVLSLIKLVEMPYGGSITIASMLPIVIVSYRHGSLWGLGSALVYAAIQQLTGLNSLSYFTTWQSILAVILLDYIIAFTVVGLGGAFRKLIKNQALALTAGAVMVSVLRYISHTIGGATVWAGLSIPDSAALIYSIGYNATYMLPETIILAAVAFYLGDVIDFRRDLPTRVKKSGSGALGWMYALSGLSFLVGLITSVMLIAPTLQEEDGMFTLARLGEANWLAIGIVMGVCLLLSLTLFLYATVAGNKLNNKGTE
ncbi:MAG: energy-coupled thiamine transporter ThiT [Clostridia bacterium]|nr:energy-coupled thiamine transporter ThiT [Clostridia bacterium]